MKILILGLDEGFKRSKPGYTDTIILVSISSLKRNIVMMSIPRDLWVQISNREENRIGAVYKTTEIKRPGEGPSAVTAIVSKSFQVTVHYNVLVRMQGFVRIVDSLGGVDITLSQPVAGCPAGIMHLDGQTALAFARNRTETDDFARMFQVQILIKGIISRVLKFEMRSKLPQVFRVLRETTESNIPFWEWVRLAFMISYSQLNRIKTYTITREMVNPKITPQGEQVLEPDWDKIRTLTQKILDK